MDCLDSHQPIALIWVYEGLSCRAAFELEAPAQFSSALRFYGRAEQGAILLERDRCFGIAASKLRARGFPASGDDTQFVGIAAHDAAGAGERFRVRVPCFGRDIDDALGDVARGADDLRVAGEGIDGEHPAGGWLEFAVEGPLEGAEERIVPVVEADVTFFGVEAEVFEGRREFDGFVFAPIEVADDDAFDAAGIVGEQPLLRDVAFEVVEGPGAFLVVGGHDAADDVEPFRRQLVVVVAAGSKLPRERHPGGQGDGLAVGQRRTHVERVRVAVPDALVEEVVAVAVARAAVGSGPFGAVVGTDAHGVEVAEGGAEAAQILHHAAPEEEHVVACGFADDAHARAVAFDGRHERIVANRLAEVVFLVLVVDIFLARTGSRVEAVHLEVFVAPVVGDAVDHLAEIGLRLGIREIDRRARPFRGVGQFLDGRVGLVAGFFDFLQRDSRVAAANFVENVLLVREEGIGPGARERHEPNARNHAFRFDVVRRGLHAARVRAFGIVRVEDFLRAVGADARLPFVVDLHDAEAPRLEVFRGEVSVLREAFLVRGAGVIPSAVDRGQRAQLDVEMLGRGVRVLFESVAHVGADADEQQLARFPGACRKPEVAVVDARAQRGLFAIPAGKDNALAAVVRRPAEYDAAAAFRIADEAEDVAAEFLAYGGQPCAAARDQAVHGFRETEPGFEDRQLIDLALAVAIVLEFPADSDQGQRVVKGDDRGSAFVGQREGLAVAEGFGSDGFAADLGNLLGEGDGLDAAVFKPDSNDRQCLGLCVEGQLVVLILHDDLLGVDATGGCEEAREQQGAPGYRGHNEILSFVAVPAMIHRMPMPPPSQSFGKLATHGELYYRCSFFFVSFCQSLAQKR